MYIFPSKLSIITKLPPLHTTALNISNETLHYCQMSLGFMVRFTVGVDGRLGVNVLQPVVSDFKAGKDSVTLTPTSRVLQEGMMLRRVGHHAQVSASILLFADRGGDSFAVGCGKIRTPRYVTYILHLITYVWYWRRMEFLEYSFM